MDLGKKADSLIHRVIKMQLFGSLFSNVEIVCNDLGWVTPSHDQVEKWLEQFSKKVAIFPNSIV